VEQVSKNIELDIISDSKYTIDGVGRWRVGWTDQEPEKSEDQGCFTTANKAVIRLTAAIKWVEGHSGDPGNEAADKLADKGAKKEAPDIISKRARRNLAVHGTKLAVMTQSSAYRIIRQIKMAKDRTPQHGTRKRSCRG
jgi:ribonuclease HI